MELAQVLVDLPTMQTNTPFTYQIPNSLANHVQIGMRVVVPFGNGHRKIQGIVVDLTSHSNYSGKLKYIDSLMDLSPVVNEEMLSLSKWLSKTTYSFRISCILTMLPSAMRAKYEKEVILKENTDDQEVQNIFHHQKRIIFNNKKLSDEQTKLLLQLKRQNKIKINYLVENQARSKNKIHFKSLLSVQQINNVLSSLPKRNNAQRELLKLLLKRLLSDSNKNDFDQNETLQNTPKLSYNVLKTCENKGWIKKYYVKQLRNPNHENIERNYPLRLNHDQSNAVNTIHKDIKNDQSNTFLLEGVTDSGKTEVYLQTIQKALIANKTALMLVPEISLTPQMVNRVKGRFGDKVAMLHSGLSKGEKYDEWSRINDGNAKIVVGVRSAIFAPLKNIGVIIMDEEHDNSYKQNSTPRYQTKEVAKWRSKYHNCPLILGSATPSLESRARAGKGVYQLLKLPHRINNQKMPSVNIVDMREEIINRQKSNFSKPLLSAIRERIRNNEQTVLMLNRRGFSSFVMCRDCGFILKCPNCDISLTLHMDTKTMRCHYCGHEEAIPNVCPQCHSHQINYYGTGTQKVEKELSNLLPNAKIVRMDVDTTSRKGAHSKLLNQFGSGKADILLGTQMIAKGLDFPNVTLVGVLNADTSLDLPDFRSSERTFQLLTQVSGRAGRSNKPGEVYIQTFNPENYSIQLAKKQDYEDFYRHEMYIRHQMNYPPYYFTVRITTSGAKEQNTAELIYSIKKYLDQKLSDKTIILGPTPSAIARIKRKYYYQIILKYKYEPYLQDALDYVLNHYQTSAKRGIYVDIDSDPVSFM